MSRMNRSDMSPRDLTPEANSGRRQQSIRLIAGIGLVGLAGGLGGCFIVRQAEQNIKQGMDNFSVEEMVDNILSTTTTQP